MKNTSKYDQIIYASLFNINDIIEENQKEAKNMLDKGQITPEEFEKIKNIDPTAQKKFMGWMARRWVEGQINDTNLQSLVNYFNEWMVYVRNRKTKSADINAYKSLKELTDEVDKLNHSGTGLSKKQKIHSGYKVVVDNDNILIAEVLNHEGSKWLGCNYFKLPDGSPSKWCTTFSNTSNWDDYHGGQGRTFYYVKTKAVLLEKIKKKYGPKWTMFAIHFPLPMYQRDDNGNIMTDPNTGKKVIINADIGPTITDWNSHDHEWSMHKDFIKEFLDFVGIPWSMNTD